MGARIDLTSALLSDVVRARLITGLYERAERRFVRDHLRGDLDVVELGTSIGVVASQAARRLQPGRRLVAVEADGRLADLARRNLAMNSAGVEWTVEEAILAYPTDKRLSFVRGTETTGGALRPTSTTAADEAIPRRRLHDVLERHSIDRYVLIADIEGAEEGIIIHDAEALSRCDQLIIELHTGPTMTVAAMRSALVEDHGFTIRAARGPVVVAER
jgi:FkbM family methyltransferase